jgi:hypothetical protein
MILTKMLWLAVWNYHNLTLTTHIRSMPAELDQIERRIRQLEIEREALRREQTVG